MKRAAAGLLLAVAPSFPARSVRELIEHAQKNPGKLTNASSSNGSPGHVAGELFKYLTGTDIVHVPYKGGAMAVNEGIRAPIFVDRFAQIGDEPAGGTPQDFAETIKKDSARWGEVVRRSGAKID